MSDTALVPRIDVPALLARAVEKDASVETLERLVALAKDVRAEMARSAWHSAMADFQANVPEVVKSKVAKVRTKSGSEYTYRYAPLQDLISATRPALAAHGLSVVFETSVTEKSVLARCLVGHADGHVQTCEFTIPIDLGSHMNPAQQVASACTYARRYAYMSALGLSPEDEDQDDDGASAGGSSARSDGPPIRKPAPQTEYTKSQDSPAWRGKLVKVEKKVSPDPKKPWELTTFVGADGTRFGTFDTNIADGLLKLDGHFVEIVSEQTAKGNRIIEYKDVSTEEVPL